MLKLREKWLWALCLAILVHIGVFYFFYLNINKETSTQLTSSSAHTVKTSAAKALNNDSPPITRKTYLPTLSETTTPNNLDNDPKDTKQITHKNTMAPSNEAKTISSLDSKKNSPTPYKTPAILPKERIQESDTLKYPANETTVSLAANNIDSIEDMRNRAGLLNIDIPTEKNAINTDKNYLSVKSEAEEINHQLSSAINEVKKRNQQKIDEMEQLKNDFDNEDHQAITQ